MPAEIAIVTTEFLRDFLVDSLGQMNLDVKYSIHPYTHFEDIAGIYGALPASVGGVLASGVFPARIMRQSHPESGRVIYPFNNDDAGLYKLFFELLNNNRQLDLKRIYADVLEIAGLDTGSYLLGTYQGPYPELLERNVAHLSLEELVATEQQVLQNHLRLWQEGRIDVSITRFSSIMETLQSAGLNAHFAFPGRDYLRTVCERTIQEVRLRKMHGNQSAAIVVTPVPGDEALREEQLAALKKALQRFNSVHQLNYIIQSKPSGLELLCSRNTIDFITEKMTTCNLQSFLATRLNFQVAVGYGLGENMYQARINAVDAGREALQHGGGASYLINERDELVSPLQSGGTLVVPRKAPENVQKLAKRTGLSSFTVQKVFAAAATMPGYRITSQELADKLSVTKRSANRFLRALHEAGQATVVGQKKSTTMGRPERIYKLEIK